MRKPFLAAGALLLATLAFAQSRSLHGLALPAHGVGGSSSDVAENLRKHSDYLQGSVEELARFIKSEPNLDPQARKAADDIVRWCKSERDFIHQDAGRINGNGTASAQSPTAAAPPKIEFTPVEPRFE